VREKSRNEIEVERTLDLLRAYWDDRASPDERVEMLQIAGDFDRDLRYMTPEEVEALAAAPFGALAPRMLHALAMAHLDAMGEADHEVEVAEKRAGRSTTP
jgi:hypothetical protein